MDFSFTSSGYTGNWGNRVAIDPSNVFGKQWGRLADAILGQHTAFTTDGANYCILRITAPSRTFPAVPSSPFASFTTELFKHNLTSPYDHIDVLTYGIALLAETLAQSRARRPERKPTIATISDEFTCSLPALALFCAVNDSFWFDYFINKHRS